MCFLDLFDLYLYFDNLIIGLIFVKMCKNELYASYFFSYIYLVFFHIPIILKN